MPKPYIFMADTHSWQPLFFRFIPTYLVISPDDARPDF